MNQKTNDDNTAAVKVEVGAENGRVVLRFPKSVTQIALHPPHAMEIGAALLKYARRANADEPLVWRVGDPRPITGDTP